MQWYNKTESSHSSLFLRPNKIYYRYYVHYRRY
nr:ALPV-003 [Albatrosspox virus]UNS14521.1 ALPV-357 [Albatrosspox virus]